MKRGASRRPPSSSPVNRRWPRRRPRRRSPVTVAAEKAATEALAAAKAATEKALADKTAQDPCARRRDRGPQGRGDARGTRPGRGGADEAGPEVRRAHPGDRGVGHVASRSASQALAQATAAKNAAPPAAAARAFGGESRHPCRPCRPRCLQSRRSGSSRATEKALAAARTALQAATNTLTAVKKEHAKASAAKAGAEKALAERKAPLDAAIARVQALKAEIDALAVERNRSDGSKGGGLASAARPNGK